MMGCIRQMTAMAKHPVFVTTVKPLCNHKVTVV